MPFASAASWAQLRAGIDLRMRRTVQRSQQMNRDAEVPMIRTVIMQEIPPETLPAAMPVRDEF
jgi:hypothetical protein